MSHFVFDVSQLSQMCLSLSSTCLSYVSDSENTMPDGVKLSCEISEAACERDGGRVGLPKRSTVFESIFFGIWSCLRSVLDCVLDFVLVVLVLS